MSRFSFVICVVSLAFNFISLGSESDIERDCGFVWKKTNICGDYTYLVICIVVTVVGNDRQETIVHPSILE